jgi:hypothetical protein
MAEAEVKVQIGLIKMRRKRVSYLWCFKPFEGEHGPSYKCETIMNRTDPEIAQITAAIHAVASAAWGDQADTILMQLKAQDRLCLKNGDISNPGREEYAGKVFLRASSKNRPTIVAQIGGSIVNVDETSEFAPYSGCIATVHARVWAQDNKSEKGGKRINAEFRGIQFVQNDKRLGGAGSPSKVDEFEVDSSDADGAAPDDVSGGLI